jgi:hypothetical protein
MIDTLAVPGPWQAETGAGIALRVQIHHQDPLIAGRKGGRQVDRRGGFAHTALLIGDRENSGSGRDAGRHPIKIWWLQSRSPQ